jgi:archaellum component FlaC
MRIDPNWSFETEFEAIKHSLHELNNAMNRLSNRIELIYILLKRRADLEAEEPSP